MSAAPTPVVRAGSALPANSFVLRQHKIVYVSTTKNASTALRWMVAELAGEDFERFYRAPLPHQSRLMTIHGERDTWQHVPTLADLPADEIAGISRDTGWLIFAVARDPWTRLWSSWQSKLLVQQGGYTRRYAAKPWFPHFPSDPEQVLADWRSFVYARPWDQDPELHTDSHFNVQVRGIRPRHVNYSRVYEVRRLDELVTDLHAHLAGLGLDKELYLPRANESPLPIVAEALEQDLVDIIAEQAKLDLAAFPGRWEPPQAAPMATAWTRDTLRIAAWRAESNQRIDDLSTELRAITDTNAWRLLRRGAAQAKQRRARLLGRRS